MVINSNSELAKNVIGIAAGMLEGFELSSLKDALMARGTNEIARLIVATVFGRSFVQRKRYGELAEGYYAVKALRKLGKII